LRSAPRGSIGGPERAAPARAPASCSCRRWPGLLLLAVTGVFIYNVFFNVGMKYTSAINAVLVIVVNPVTTAIVAVTLLGEPWSWRLVAGVTLSFLGVLATITKGSLAVLTSLSFNSGSSAAIDEARPGTPSFNAARRRVSASRDFSWNEVKMPMVNGRVFGAGRRRE
jgi:drug/metabolite transporter (DMT)-like permease